MKWIKADYEHKDEEKHFANHDMIYDEAKKLFDGNMNTEGEHNREALDDLIRDLEQYKNTLHSPDDYMKEGLL